VFASRIQRPCANTPDPYTHISIHFPPATSPLPLEHDDGLRIRPAGADGGDLPAVAAEPLLEPLDIHGPVPRGVRGQAEQNLAFHLGETPQLPAQELLVVGAGLLVQGSVRRV
jgi:hypothetical protein